MSVIDTATLGPIRVEPNDLALRAKVAGEALIAAMENDPTPEVRKSARLIVSRASPVSLAKLGRGLK